MFKFIYNERTMKEWSLSSIDYTILGKSILSLDVDIYEGMKPMILKNS